MNRQNLGIVGLVLAGLIVIWGMGVACVPAHKSEPQIEKHKGKKHGRHHKSPTFMCPECGAEIEMPAPGPRPGEPVDGGNMRPDAPFGGMEAPDGGQQPCPKDGQGKHKGGAAPDCRPAPMNPAPDFKPAK